MATLRTYCSNDGEPVVSGLANGPSSTARLGPDPSQGALLTEPGLILEPDFDSLAQMLGFDLLQDGGKVFLNAS